MNIKSIFKKCKSMYSKTPAIRTTFPAIDPNLPSFADICPSACDLDELWAAKNFHGKSQEEAAKLFFESSIYYIDDLLWMGGKAFTFYFPCLEPYLVSKESEEDSDAISHIASYLKLRLEQDPLSIQNCSTDILRILTYISTHIEKFDITVEIYGDLKTKVHDLIAKIQIMESNEIADQNQGDSK